MVCIILFDVMRFSSAPASRSLTDRGFSAHIMVVQIWTWKTMVTATHTQGRASKRRPLYGPTKTDHNRSTTLHCASSAVLQVPQPIYLEASAAAAQSMAKLL